MAKPSDRDEAFQLGFVARLREAMARHPEVSQAELDRQVAGKADARGASGNTSRLLRGERGGKISAATVLAYAEALGESPAWLMGIEPEEQEAPPVPAALAKALAARRDFVEASIAREAVAIAGASASSLTESEWNRVIDAIPRARELVRATVGLPSAAPAAVPPQSSGDLHRRPPRSRKRINQPS